MGKVFTITDGLENMGALKTGGQGSVYKGRRIGEIITAVKLLPTPIASESPEDKNFLDFQNEVQKLKKVNEVPNPNVVKILSSGITESGGFPFIEMEFIEGPDLEELLKEPRDPVFTIKEAIRVAEHLSNALSHCHSLGIMHGDIKSNNVKLNLHTANYVLLDFGLAVMSDEQRRTSLRHAGAIEFMAPEQNEGRLQMETDIYSFGVIIFELLAGQVPFPLEEGGETARNTVMLSHMESQPPELADLREKNLPSSWSNEKRISEMQLPNWVVSMLYKCLEKEPRNRFANGKELHDFIALNSALMTHKEETSLAIVDTIEEDNERLLQERDQLQREVLRYQQALQEKETAVARLQQTVQDKEAALLAASSQPVQASRASAPIRQQGVSKGAFYSLLLLTLLLGGLAAFALLKDREPEERIAGSNMNTPKDTLIAQDQSSAKSRVVEKERRQPAAVPPKPVAKEPTGNTTTKAATVNEEQRATDIAAAKEERKREEENRNRKKDEARETDKGATTGERYKVISRAYFHNEPSAETRRNAFIVHWNNAVLRPVEERDGYVYVIFTNTEGQTSKGWLDKKDLRKLE